MLFFVFIASHMDPWTEAINWWNSESRPNQWGPKFGESMSEYTVMPGG